MNLLHFNWLKDVDDHAECVDGDPLQDEQPESERADICLPVLIVRIGKGVIKEVPITRKQIFVQCWKTLSHSRLNMSHVISVIWVK